jgi:hypothetical protein
MRSALLLPECRLIRLQQNIPSNTNPIPLSSLLTLSDGIDPWIQLNAYDTGG